MSRSRHLVLTGFAFGPRRRLIASALIAIAAVAAVFAGAGNRTASASEFGNYCLMLVHFRGGSEKEGLTLVHASKWDTDSWGQYPPARIRHDKTVGWQSEGGALRGCHNEVKYHVVCTGFCEVDEFGHEIPLGTVEISETLPWRGSESSHCVIRGIRGVKTHGGGDTVFLGSRCSLVQEEMATGGYFGRRSLGVVWYVDLGELCVQHISPTRTEICL